MKDLLFKSEFYEDINYLRFVIGLVLLIALTKTLQYIYRRFSNSPTNKKSFSSIFILFSVSIFLIVTTIKSSLALSLGMVGALSIIRFRTAIKEPEQLIYFLGITGVAIAIAAEKEILAVLVVLVFIISAFVNNKNKDPKLNDNIKYLMLNGEINENTQDIDVLSNFLSSQLEGGLQCKNFFEDSHGNIRMVFSIGEADKLNLKEVKSVLKQLNFNHFSLKIID
jgi:hypothetical protein